jgi:hypothetical protein
MFDTSKKLFNCSILTSADAEYINSALLRAALKQALRLLCEALWLKHSWDLLHANNKYARIAHVLAVEMCRQYRLI